ncbi:MAG: TonB-dependent receptor, partial [Treponemataceae bacterium]|nr:TonB-dependent receptor [Treponemataceae bacterium]
NTKNADYYVGVLVYEQEVWKKHLWLQADASITEARLRESGKQIMWVPEYQAHVGINFKYSAFESLIDFSYTSWRYTSNDNSDFYPGFYMLDALISWQVNPEFSLYAKGTNILDANVVYHDSYYIPGRKWTLGARFKK